MWFVINGLVRSVNNTRDVLHLQWSSKLEFIIQEHRHTCYDFWALWAMMGYEGVSSVKCSGFGKYRKIKLEKYEKYTKI